MPQKASTGHRKHIFRLELINKSIFLSKLITRSRRRLLEFNFNDLLYNGILFLETACTGSLLQEAQCMLGGPVQAGLHGQPFWHFVHYRENSKFRCLDLSIRKQQHTFFICIRQINYLARWRTRRYYHMIHRVDDDNGFSNWILYEKWNPFPLLGGESDWRRAVNPWEPINNADESAVHTPSARSSIVSMW